MRMFGLLLALFCTAKDRQLTGPSKSLLRSDGEVRL
jgi:hypothetical protein